MRDLEKAVADLAAAVNALAAAVKAGGAAAPPRALPSRECVSAEQAKARWAEAYALRGEELPETYEGLKLLSAMKGDPLLLATAPAWAVEAFVARAEADARHAAGRAVRRSKRAAAAARKSARDER
jgi:hypothetical protein